MEKIKKFLDKFGWVGVIRLFFYPITALLTNPVRLAQTLWACCRVLADGKWSQYNRFTAWRALNSLFYWTQAINIDRYGRSGTSPHLGLGTYKLSSWFHISLPSLYLYWRMSPILLLVSAIGWIIAHFTWLTYADSAWVLLVIGLASISTTLYANTFVLQNYNMAGWLFFPIGLYGMATEQWAIASIAWVAASFSSFTVVFLAGILSAIAAFSSWSIAPLLAIAPATLKLLSHFRASINSGIFSQSILQTAKSIGIANNKAVKYKRKSSKRITIIDIYYLIIYGQFCIICYILNPEFSILPIAGVVIYLINSTLIRFADPQSIYMFIFSIATGVMLQNPAPWLLPSYWILASPIPLLSGFASIETVLDILPILVPFSVQPFIEDMEAFLAPVPKNKKILMAFENPQGIYEKIFDGYRTLLELPLYVAAKKEIHFIPDWWAVFQLNYEGAPDFWGRDIKAVQKNIERWNADYVVVYQNAGTELEQTWPQAGFEILSHFSWADYEDCLQGEKPYSGEIPTWWLLKIPTDSSSPLMRYS